MARMINRDSFARQELWKKGPFKGSCDWCGNKCKGYMYFIEDDSGRQSPIKGLFCSISCMRSYLDN